MHCLPNAPNNPETDLDATEFCIAVHELKHLPIETLEDLQGHIFAMYPVSIEVITT